ncbi:MAG: hypothetical protein M1830_007501 [Pleopsidium flavum]|nr:MAG: hypothetical protein M1830_007501 [Pleopsidium flavum]
MDDMKRGHFDFMVPEKIDAEYDSTSWSDLSAAADHLNDGCPTEGGILTAGQHHDLAVIMFGPDGEWNKYFKLLLGLDLFALGRTGVVALTAASATS